MDVDRALEGYRELLGTVDDSEIAGLAGVPVAAVARMRERLGVPAWRDSRRHPRGPRPASQEELRAWRASHGGEDLTCYEVRFAEGSLHVVARTVDEALLAAARHGVPVGVEPIGRVL